MKRPFKTMPEFMSQIVVSGRHRRHDGALLSSHIPKSTGHGSRGGGHRNACDTGAILISILTNQIFDFGLRQHTQRLLHRRKPDCIHLGRSHGHGLTSHQQAKSQQKCPRSEVSKHQLVVATRQEWHFHRACKQCTNKCPNCEWVVCPVVTMVHCADWTCQKAHPSARLTKPSLVWTC